MPIISEMPGFVAYYCVDAGDGVMVSISLFEHKAAEEESTFRAGEFVAEDLGPLSRSHPESRPESLSYTRRSRRDTERVRALDVRAGAVGAQESELLLPLFTNVGGRRILGNSYPASRIARPLRAARIAPAGFR